MLFRLNNITRITAITKDVIKIVLIYFCLIFVANIQLFSEIKKRDRTNSISYKSKVDEILLSISLIIFLVFNLLKNHITIAMIRIKGQNNPITADVIQTALLLLDEFPSITFLAQTNNIIAVVSHTDKTITPNIL